MRRYGLLLGAVIGLAPLAWGDTIVLRDGRNIKGTLDGESGDSLRVRQDDDGLISVLLVPKSNFLKVIPDKDAVRPKPPAAPEAVAPPPPPPAPTAAPVPRTTVVAPAPTATPAAGATTAPSGPQANGHFLHEMLAMGHIVPHERMAPLTPDDRKAFDDLIIAHRRGESAAQDFTQLDALAHSPTVPRVTLSVLCYDAVGMGLGKWLSDLRWGVLQTERTRTGVLKTDDIIDFETPYFAQDLKAATPDALQQIGSYLPDPTLPYGQQRKDQDKLLATISVDNCLDVKDKALWAALMLDGQLKLTPHLSDDDQRVLKQRLGQVRAIITQCFKYETKARAELLKKQAADKKNGK
jgi:hypothetical protein